MKPAYCLGIYLDDNYTEYACYFRDQCQYHPSDTRWLTTHWDTLSDYQEIHPPAMPPPPNMKTAYTGPEVCHCPYFLPKPKPPKNIITTPFD